jgi:hypothetical protein
MLHYWTADDPTDARQVQVEDWIEDLFEFSDAVVEEACRTWRRTQGKRPTPKELRVIAIAEQRFRDRKSLPPLPEEDTWILTEEQIIAKITSRWGRGWKTCWYGERYIEEPKE